MTRALAPTLVRVIAIAVLGHVIFVSARMTGTLYALAHQASAWTVGLLLALFALMPMFIAVSAGRWIDRVGARRPMRAGLTLLFMGALLPALWPYERGGVLPLLAASTLMGTGQMLVLIPVQQWVGERTAPAQRTAAFSWLALGISTSGMVGPIASGALIDALGHRTVYGVLLLVALAAGALLWSQRDVLPHHSQSQAPGASTHPFELLRHTSVRQVLAASVLVSMSWDLQTFMVPVHGHAVGLSASAVGLILGIFAAATFVVRAAMPWLSRHFDEWTLLGATLVCAALAFALFPFFHTLAALSLVAFLLGLGLGAAQPNVMSLLHARAPQGRVAEALGLRTTLMNSSHVALPLVYGASASVLGVATLFWTTAVALAIGACVIWRKLRFS